MALTDMIANSIMNDPRFQHNQVMQNAFTMYRNGDIKGLGQFTQNACREKGQDINTLYNQAQSLFRR